MRRLASALLVPVALVALAACSPSGNGQAPPVAPPPPAPPPAATTAGEHGEPEHAPALPAPVSLPSEAGEAGVLQFLTEFMESRMIQNEARARDFLSPTALEQYGPDGLPLTDDAWTGWELVALNAADASSWEAKVRLRQEGGAVEETLFLGPGPDASGTQRIWIVRGATRS